jgi:CheY-like chemotaxis protein
MTDVKPQVVYFSDEQETVDLVKLFLSHKFEVTGVTGATGIDDALNALRQLKPDYVLVDPHLPDLDHRQLHRQIKADEELKEIQILVIRDDEVDPLR